MQRGVQLYPGGELRVLKVNGENASNAGCKTNYSSGRIEVNDFFGFLFFYNELAQIFALHLLGPIVSVFL